MKPTRGSLLILTILLWALVVSASVAGGCGVWRHDVKTMSDADAHQVASVSLGSTVEDLRALVVPGVLTKDTARFHIERLTYTVIALPLRAKLEADQDFHVVIAGRTGQTMIVEFVAPDCAGARAKTAITRAR